MNALLRGNCCSRWFTSPRRATAADGRCCHYFSEAFRDKNCGACDNCLDPKETFDGTEAAQKFLACLYRIREKSGFGFGLNHVVEVLTGADTEAIRKWGHDQVSTHGIGDEFGRDESEGNRSRVDAAWLRAAHTRPHERRGNDAGRKRLAAKQRAAEVDAPRHGQAKE